MRNNIEGLYTEGGTVIKYEGSAEELNLPVYIRRIAPYAFHNCKTLKTIIMPSRLESIGKGAFYGCDNLVQAVLPGRLFLRAKGNNVFDDAGKIFFRFFTSQSGTEAEDADYSDVFQTEEEYVSSGSKQSEINSAPDRRILGTEEGEHFLNNLDDGFVGAEYEPSLDEKKEAIVPPERSADGLSDEQRRELINERNYLIDGDTVIRYIGAEKQTEVPSHIVYIAENAFSNSGVTAVRLPSGLKSIGKGAFSWCDKLVGIDLPPSLEVIEDSAFAQCQSLAAINSPASVKFIGANAFHACSGAKKLSLPYGVKVISRRAFDFCTSLEKVIVPSSVEVLQEGAFAHCESLVKVSLPDGLKEIGDWAFAECYELREINFPAGLEVVGEVAFFNCRSLIAFDFPASVHTVGRQAFTGCDSLHLATLPKALMPQLRPKKVFHGVKNVTIEYLDEKTIPN